MTEKEKKLFKSIKTLKTEYPATFRIITMFLILAIIVIPIAIFLAYLIGDIWGGIPTRINAGDALVYWGSFLAFIGTVSLGIVALCQNTKFKKENDIAQERLNAAMSELSKANDIVAEANTNANQISCKLLQLEEDRFRPYIMINIEPIFYVSKEARRFSSVIDDKISGSDFYFKGTSNNYQGNLDFVHESMAFFFSLKNIGKSPIAEVCLDKGRLLNVAAGDFIGVERTLDTSLIDSEQKNISLIVMQQVDNMDGNLKTKIQRELERQFELNYDTNLHIALSLNYKDIYGRSYCQDYSIHATFKKEKESENEYEIKLLGISIEHHTDKSLLFE